MPWYGFIHPVFAVATLVYGVSIAQTGMSKSLDWDFPLRRQRTRSIVFLVLCVANLALGLLVNAALRGRGAEVELTFHLPLAIIVSALALIAVILGYVRPKRPGEVTGAMKFQHWFIILASVGILTMLLIGLLESFWR